MDPSAMDFTMHHSNHHHPHYQHHHHHHPNGASSSASTSRCPALRAAAEQRGYPLPNISSTRGSVQYDPVHAHAGNRNFWQSRSPQNWRPAMITPFSQGTFPAQTPPNQPQPSLCPMPDISNMASVPDTYAQQIPPFQQFRPTMHPAPRLLNQPPFENPVSFPSSNSSQSSTQTPTNRPVQSAGLPSAASLLSVPPVPVPPSRTPITSRQTGQTTSFGNENIRPGQQLPNLFPHLFTTPFSQPSDPMAHATAPVEEGSTRLASQSPPAPASTAPQRTNDQPGRIISPVEIRRASTAGMGRARRSISRYTASSPSEWLNDGGNLLFRRGDLVEFVENFPGTISDGEGPVTGRFVRGGPAKRVASKKALASLQSVSIADLPESERTCVICYNDFGVANPEGVNEAPLRLPKCKHVFGDHCIKKWFQESDSCPYCRDKVHSELQHMPTRRSHPGFRFIPPYQITPQHLPGYQGYQGREQSRSRDIDVSELDSSTQTGQTTGTNMSDRSSQFPDILSNRPPSGSGRFENTARHGMRLPSWSSAHERRSPPVEYDRRRRPRHRARVSPPLSRPSILGGQTSNGASQTSVRPSRSSRSRSPFDPTSTGVDLSSRRSLTNSPEQYHWNGSSSPNPTTGAITLTPPSGPLFDASGFPFQSQMMIPPDDFLRGFVSSHSDEAPGNEHSSGLPQMRSDTVRFSSPSTSAGSSDVYVAASGHATSNQFTSYQQS
ncbi:hypothetical protein F5Y12DRAFT_784724 [Xylaria sp. FL1777]|nr:hypothetical protein F5Y12DRAFT_784724 [Xylaria sp. FL1777]